MVGDEVGEEGEESGETSTECKELAEGRELRKGCSRKPYHYMDF